MLFDHANNILESFVASLADESQNQNNSTNNNRNVLATFDFDSNNVLLNQSLSDHSNNTVSSLSLHSDHNNSNDSSNINVVNHPSNTAVLVSPQACVIANAISLIAVDITNNDDASHDELKQNVHISNDNSISNEVIDTADTNKQDDDVYATVLIRDISDNNCISNTTEENVNNDENDVTTN